MMRMKGKITLLLIVFIGLAFTAPLKRDVPSCKEVLLKMFEEIKKIKTLEYRLVSTERVEGEISRSTSFVKIKKNPLEVYFKGIESSVEVLWRLDKNGGKALVYPGGFPYINLWLDPMGERMRAGQHHTLYELGFSYIGTTIATTLVKNPKQIAQHFSNKGRVVWNDRNCFNIVADYTGLFDYFEYEVQKGESVYSIAKKFSVADYMIREKNNLRSYYGKLVAGKKILIPNNYAAKTIMYVDEETHLPIYVEVHDEQGFYESYAFIELKTNEAFDADEFTEDYEGYGF